MVGLPAPLLTVLGPSHINWHIDTADDATRLTTQAAILGKGENGKLESGGWIKELSFQTPPARLHAQGSHVPTSPHVQRSVPNPKSLTAVDMQSVR